jgi:hypothetical protein
VRAYGFNWRLFLPLLFCASLWFFVIHGTLTYFHNHPLWR